MKRALLAVAALMLFGSLAQAGIVRHVVRPVAKKSASVVAKTVKATAHVTKRVVY